MTAFLLSLPLLISSQCDVLSSGGYIERTLHIREPVCDVMHTAIVAKDHTLHLEPGVKLRFAPGVMLAINGTLLAKVDRDKKRFLSTYVCLVPIHGGLLFVCLFAHQIHFTVIHTHSK